MFGIALRIPIGGRGQENCDQFLRIEASQLKLRKAQEMFETGLINEEQLKRIAADAYKVIAAP